MNCGPFFFLCFVYSQVCVYVLACVSLCVPHESRCSQKPEEDLRLSEAEVAGIYEPPCASCKLNLGPL